jgi:ABC-2 type transport system permease protein
MATGNSAMELRTGSGWSRGLDTMLRGELKHWFGTRRWWVQILIWAAAVNLIFMMVAFSTKRLVDAGEAAPGMGRLESLMIFNIFMGLAGPVGVSILMQGAVVGEKRSGTAAWVLSKPASRTSFVLSKLLGNSVGVTLTMVVAQGVIAYLIAGLVLDLWLPVPSFAAGMGVHLVNIFFYLTMTLMLGAMLSQIAPVIGIPLAFLFAQNQVASFYPAILKVLPWTLAIPSGGPGDQSVAAALIAGEAVPPLLPVYTTLAASAVFVAVALWVFRRQEL